MTRFAGALVGLLAACGKPAAPVVATAPVAPDAALAAVPVSTIDAPVAAPTCFVHGAIVSLRTLVGDKDGATFCTRPIEVDDEVAPRCLRVAYADGGSTEVAQPKLPDETITFLMTVTKRGQRPMTHMCRGPCVDIELPPASPAAPDAGWRAGFTPDAKLVYAVREDLPTVFEIDVARATIARRIPVDPTWLGMKKGEALCVHTADPVGANLYVSASACSTDGIGLLLDARGKLLVATKHVNAFRSVPVLLDDGRVAIADRAGGDVEILDPTKRMSTRIVAGAECAGCVVVDAATSISPLKKVDGTLLTFSGFGVSVIDPKSAAITTYPLTYCKDSR